MLRGLRTVVFDVDDLATAKAWYAEAVGGAPYFDEPFYVGFDVGGYELGLRPSESPRVPGDGGATTYWAVDDLDGAFASLTARGAEAREQPVEVGGGIRVASVTDPFGNALGLIYNPHFAATLTHARADDISERVITKHAVVPCARDEAFRLWSTEAGLASWWTDKTRIELRPGGAFELHFLDDNPPGHKGADWCRVLSFLPGRMLSFTWNAPPNLRTRPLMTWVVVTFEPAPDDAAHTRVTLSHLGWPASGLADDATDWPATWAYFDDAWERVMTLLAAHA